MSDVLPTPLTVLRAALRLLRRHLGWVAGIAGLVALLSALAPLLQLRFHLGDDLVTQAALRAATLLPLELYVLPRFLAMVDAETRDLPQNPRAQWQARFEERWLKTFGARLLLYVVCGTGLMFFVIPGLVALAIFGWAPFLVLLRGEPVLQAFRGSAALMAKLWPVALRAVLPIFGLYLVVALGIGLGLDKLIPEPSPWQRLTHPLLWISQAVAGLLEVALSVVLLALFQALEAFQSSSSK